MRMSDGLEPGDLVYCKWIGDMTHWGVYIGNNKVVHLTVSRSFKSFFGYHKKGLVKLVDLHEEEYQWRKNNDKDKDYPPSPVQEIIERANAALKIKTSKYNLVTFNCEHFASFCRYGVDLSYQVLNAGGIAAGVPLAALTQLISKWVKSDETQRTCTTPEFQALLNQAISEIEEFFKHKEQSGEPSSSAKGFLSVGIRIAASTTIPAAKFFSALGPHGRHCHLGLDFLKIPLTIMQGREWMADCASALNNFLKTSPSMHIRGIGAMLGLLLAVTTTEPCIKWSIEAADFAAFFAHFLPQKSDIELMSVVKSMLTSLDGKEGFNMHLSIAATVLGLYPPTRVLGAAVDVFRTIMYELPGKGYNEGALCLVKCVVRNVDVVPFVSTGVKWIGSWFGW